MANNTLHENAIFDLQLGSSSRAVHVDITVQVACKLRPYTTSDKASLFFECIFMDIFSLRRVHPAGFSFFRMCL